MQCNAMQYNTLQYKKYNPVQYSAMQYNEIQKTENGPKLSTAVTMVNCRTRTTTTVKHRNSGAMAIVESGT